jgi:biopolymer transport protein TolR
MARTFRRQRQAHPIAEMNVTNLIDLGFTLLIIFMIATPLINQNQAIPVHLPLESKSLQAKPDASDRFVVITVDVQGRYFLENRMEPISLTELRARLGAYAAQTKPPIVRIRGDGDVPYRKMITLMDELKKANLLKLDLDTQTDQ